MVQKKLVQLFEENKEQLYKELQELYLPQDKERIQLICIDFVENLLSKKSEYMQNIKAEEDIVKPILKLIKILQPNISVDWNEARENVYVPEIEEIEEETNDRTSFVSRKEGITVGATSVTAGAISAIIGGGIFAFLISSIVGAAVGVVLVRILDDEKEKQMKQKTIFKKNISIQPQNAQLSSNDIELLVGKISEAIICIDLLLSTYHAQISIIEDKYQGDMENLLLEKRYSNVLKCIQNIVGTSLEPENTNNIALMELTKDIKRTLQVEGYEIIEYTDETVNFFELKISDSVDKPTMFHPAIKNINLNKPALKGLVFIPETKK